MTCLNDFDCTGINCADYDYDCSHCMDCHGFFDDLEFEDLSPNEIIDDDD